MKETLEILIQDDLSDLVPFRVITHGRDMSQKTEAHMTYEEIFAERLKDDEFKKEYNALDKGLDKPGFVYTVHCYALGYPKDRTYLLGVYDKIAEALFWAIRHERSRANDPNLYFCNIRQHEINPKTTTDGVSVWGVTIGRFMEKKHYLKVGEVL